MLHGTGRETFDAVKLMQSIQKQPYTPANGAKYPNGRFGQSLAADRALDQGERRAGGGLRRHRRLGHARQRSGARRREPASWRICSKISARALAAFYQDLGDRMEDVAVVTMSEFGRTAKENGNRGTDHGHANVMFAIGGGIRGGKVYGDWPGLAPEQLYENRDLDLTTDFRDVLGELVARHLGNSQLAGVFPEYTQPKFRGLMRG